jgi:hypothetical protein
MDKCTAYEMIFDSYKAVNVNTIFALKQVQIRIPLMVCWSESTSSYF